MNVDALLTSAGINVAICVALLSFYSILRKQPGNVCVYFGRRLAQERLGRDDPFCYDRLFPSASWMVKAWATTEDEILAAGGLDAVVLVRVVIFSIRVFSIAALFCMLLVLPLNYYGKEMIHKEIHDESLDVFTIANVREGSEWLWAHCLSLWIISLSACTLLYCEYKRIARMRLAHITRSGCNPSHFAILVRSIPRSEESYSDSVRKFFTNYHAATYLSHQMIYKCGAVQKLMNDAEKVYKKIYKSPSVHQMLEPCLIKCNFCGGQTNSFKKLPDLEGVEEKPSIDQVDSDKQEKECAAAFIFFKTRYAAFVASEVLQSSNPMLWVTDMAPEPEDVYWSNLWIPFRQLWIRKIATLLAATVFMLFFLGPVTFVQGLSQLDKLHKIFPFLKGLLNNKLISRLVTGYLPSVVLMLFLYAVPPTMILFSAIEGPISRSGRKKSACMKVLYFTIWNVFFVSVLSGSVINKLNAISSPKDIPAQLASAVPTQATFFITYVLTSGWASLSSEVVQLFALLVNLFYKFILWRKEGPSNFPFTFPYHTEVPKVLLFGLLGFTCAILAPLILPFLLFYFCLAYIVYRNQFVNVYVTKYDTGGLYWPVAHNTTIFSLVLAQIIALGVFGLKRSPVASGFTIPLVILTLLFNEYCRQRFYPIFKSISAQDLIEMDRRDEQSGNLEEIYDGLQSVYCQAAFLSNTESSKESSPTDSLCVPATGDGNPGSEVLPPPPALANPTFGTVPLSGMRQAVTWLSMLATAQAKSAPKQEKPKSPQN
ncbi:CSC1-like protein rxw8 [Ranunculus cassubicifolius]